MSNRVVKGLQDVPSSSLHYTCLPKADVELDVQSLLTLAWNASKKLPHVTSQSNGAQVFSEVVGVVVESVLSHSLYSLGLIPMPLAQLFVTASELQRQEEERMHEMGEEQSGDEMDRREEMTEEDSERKRQRQRQKRRLSVAERKLMNFAQELTRILQALVEKVCIAITDNKESECVLKTVSVLLGPSIHNVKRMIRIHLLPLSPAPPPVTDTQGTDDVEMDQCSLFPANLDAGMVTRLLDRVRRLTIQRLISFSAETGENDLHSKSMAPCSLFLATEFLRLPSRYRDGDVTTDHDDDWEKDVSENGSEGEELFVYSEDFSLPPIAGSAMPPVSINEGPKQGHRRRKLQRQNKPKPLEIEVVFTPKFCVDDEEIDEMERDDDVVAMDTESSQEQQQNQITTIGEYGYPSSDESDSNDSDRSSLETENVFWWLQRKGIKTLKLNS
jgi:hypothetical protein